MALDGARVLVTGGHGFLGRHVCAAVASRGGLALPVGRAECDLRNPVATAHYMSEERPDYVVHAAAVGGGIGWMKDHPATALAGNVLVNTSVFEACREVGVRRVVGVSSACAYAREATQPMEESTLFLGEPEPTNGPYGHSKRLMMMHGRALHEEFGLDCAFVVPTNLYGPGESFDPLRAHVVGALVRRLEAARSARDATVTCWGSGRATRDLLYAPDAAEAILDMLERGGGPEPVNVGSGVERSIAQIAAAVATAVGFDGEICWDPSKPDGMPRKVLAIEKMYRRTGWTPQTDFASGLQATVACFRSST